MAAMEKDHAIILNNISEKNSTSFGFVLNAAQTTPVPDLVLFKQVSSVTISCTLL